jgi:SAM-dependent methyltransferase
MIYASPVRSDLASGQYYDTEAAGYYLSPAKLESDYAGVRFERELRVFQKHCPGGIILDVGCSSGAFLHQLRKRFSDGYEVLGMDASGPALDYAESQGIPVVRGDYLRQDFAGRKFDAVTFWAVLEHVINPGAFLQKAADLLSEGGFCFVLVPNMRSLAARMLGARYRYIYSQHVNYFTRTTLLALARNWFDPVEVRFTHFNPIVVLQGWRRGGSEVSNAERGELLQRTTSYKQNSWLKPLKMVYSFAEKTLARFALADNLLVVLRKKSPGSVVPRPSSG